MALILTLFSESGGVVNFFTSVEQHSAGHSPTQHMRRQTSLRRAKPPSAAIMMNLLLSLKRPYMVAVLPLLIGVLPGHAWP